ncbi:hypothetical protein [Buchnera aphidicola]|uniref:PTS system glucose-specific EIIA component n=1 Tax=Buchnera aphidicola (Cinara laricifoliae) TaxID=2518977 RepID=A0A451DAU8_9GAMM|nr:hypothetical protein [Buchnera aphidicola]VFP83509.1 PTS system glucose-specific EIIA component [Buchnera aphidicola (Cinara laricifoliae)]
MKKIIYIVSPITGTIQNIYETKNLFTYKKKIIINSKKNIIVSPINGKIKNNFSKEISFTIQSNPDIHILIKNKNNNIFPSKIHNCNVCAGEIILLLSNLDNNKKSNYYQTTIKISCKKKIKKTKKFLYKVQAGITILAVI